MQSCNLINFFSWPSPQYAACSSPCYHASQTYRRFLGIHLLCPRYVAPIAAVAAIATECRCFNMLAVERSNFCCYVVFLQRTLSPPSLSPLPSRFPPGQLRADGILRLISAQEMGPFDLLNIKLVVTSLLYPFFQSVNAIIHCLAAMCASGTEDVSKVCHSSFTSAPRRTAKSCTLKAAGIPLTPPKQPRSLLMRSLPARRLHGECLVARVLSRLQSPKALVAMAQEAVRSGAIWDADLPPLMELCSSSPLTYAFISTFPAACRDIFCLASARSRLIHTILFALVATPCFCPCVACLSCSCSRATSCGRSHADTRFPTAMPSTR